MMKPILSAELILIFDTDICEKDLTRILSIKDYTLSQKSQNKVNPITEEKNDGYWCHKVSEIESYDSEDIQNEIRSILRKHQHEFKQMEETFNARLIVRLFANITDEYPAFMFENECLKAICDLNGTLDIVLE